MKTMDIGFDEEGKRKVDGRVAELTNMPPVGCTVGPAEHDGSAFVLLSML